MAVEHNAPVVNMIVIVAWVVAALKDPVRLAFWVKPNVVTVTVAAVGYVRHTLGPPGAVGLGEVDEPDELDDPPHAIPSARQTRTDVRRIVIGEILPRMPM